MFLISEQVLSLKLFKEIVVLLHVVIRLFLVIKVGIFVIREYRNNNISLNIWIIDSPWIFSYFWCQGVSSVTTRRIDWLTPLQEPVWTMVGTLM